MILFLSKFIDITNIPFLFLLLALLCHILSIIIINYRNKTNNSLNNASKDFLLFTKYFDRYYVSNIYYTILQVMLYFILMFGVFFFFRILLIGYELHINSIETTTFNSTIILRVIFLMVSFMIFIVFYRTLLDVLFSTEYIKFYYYMSFFYKSFKSLENYITLRKIHSLFHDLEGTLDYMTCSDEYLEDSETYKYYSECFELLSSNWEIITKMRNYVKNYLSLYYCTKLFHYIIKNYRNHLYRLYIFPQTLILLIGCTELFQGKFYYIYYFLPIIFIINLLAHLCTFLQSKEKLMDLTIMQYFYGNTIAYSKIRRYFSNKYDAFDNEGYYTTQTKALRFHYEKELINYISKNFRKESVDVNTTKGIRSKIHKEQLLIVILFTVFNYGTTKVVFIYLLLIILYYLSTKVSYYTGEVDEPVDNSKYSKAFWVLFIIELYIMWILIFQAKFTFMESEILWNYGIEIKKIYSIEEKHEYFEKYFDYLLKMILLPETQSYFKSLIETLNVKHKIIETTTLNEIRNLTISTIKTCFFLEEIKFLCIKDILFSEHQKLCEEMLEEKYIVFHQVRSIAITVAMTCVFLDKMIDIILWSLKDVLIDRGTNIIIDIVYNNTGKIPSTEFCKGLAIEFLRYAGFRKFYMALRNYIPSDIDID